MTEFNNYTIAHAHTVHYPLWFCLISCLSLCKMVHVLFVCASVCYMYACLRGVKYCCLYVLMYVCVQLALLSTVLVVGVCSDNVCLKLPLIPVMLSHTLVLMYAQSMMPLMAVLPLVKVSNVIVDVTLEYCGIVGRIGINMYCWSKKQTLIFLLCCCFTGVSSMGCGLPFALLLLLVRRFNFAILLRDVVSSVVVLGGGKEGNSTTMLCSVSNAPDELRKSSRAGKKHPLRSGGKENFVAGDCEPPKKHGQKSMYGEHSCGDCTVWLQTGGDEALKKFHKKEIRMRHPGDKCIEFSSYLSCQGHYTITLRTDSCLCNACHRDCLRSCGKPRWLGLAKHAVCKHCFVCCEGPSSCACDTIYDWGPTQGLDTRELERWVECMQWTVNTNIGQEQNICKSHYVTMHQAMTNRMCKFCNNGNSDKWMLGKELLKELGPCTSEYSEVGVRDWVCESCFNAVVYPRSSTRRQSKYALARSEILEHALRALHTDGACMIYFTHMKAK